MSVKYTGSTARRSNALVLLACVGAVTLTACGIASTPRGSQGPAIAQITASDQSFSIDCPPTAITVTAQITAASGVTRAVLWYRVDTEQPYTSKNMEAANAGYSATVKGTDLPPGPYGILQFYITAEDSAGNKSQSPVDQQSVQFLPCVSN